MITLGGRGPTGATSGRKVDYGTTASLPAHTRAGNVLTASANGVLSIDGVAMTAGKRLLVKDETLPSPDHGWFDVTNPGAAGAPWELTRSAGADVDWAVQSGQFTFVDAGSTLSNTVWVLSSDGPFQLGTTSLVFEPAGSAYAGGGAWADGTANPATNVEAQLDKIVSDLGGTGGGSAGSAKVSVANRNPWLDGTANTGTASVQAALAKLVDDLVLQTTNASGGHKIGVDARPSWLGGRANTAASVADALDKIIDDLGATVTGDDGAERIGAQGTTGSPDSLTSGSLRSQLDALLVLANARARKGSAESITGAWTYSSLLTANGATGDTSAALATTTAATTRKLLWEFALDATLKGRLYASVSGEIELTINARWNGTDYTRDSTSASSMRLTLYATGLKLEYKAAATGTFSTWGGMLDLNAPTAQTNTLGADAQMVGAGQIDVYIAVQASSATTGNVNTGVGTNYGKKFPANPSSITYTVHSSANVATGPNTFSQQPWGHGAYATPTTAGATTYFYASASVS